MDPRQPWRIPRGDDPIVLAHARALLTSAPEGQTAYLDADANDPDAILARAAGTLDFTRPVAITLLLILHVIPDVTFTLYGHAEVARFFDGMELLEPGVVPVNHWRPVPGGPDPARELPMYAAVGRKR